jgi:hypothetical protein
LKVLRHFRTGRQRRHSRATFSGKTVKTLGFHSSQADRRRSGTTQGHNTHDHRVTAGYLRMSLNTVGKSDKASREPCGARLSNARRIREQAEWAVGHSQWHRQRKPHKYPTPLGHFQQYDRTTRSPSARTPVYPRHCRTIRSAFTHTGQPSRWTTPTDWTNQSGRAQNLPSQHKGASPRPQELTHRTSTRSHRPSLDWAEESPSVCLVGNPRLERDQVNQASKRLQRLNRC